MLTRRRLKLGLKSTKNKGYSQNVVKGIYKKNKEFNFGSQNDDLRPVSNKSDSRTSTSTPFGNFRNNLNSTVDDGGECLKISKELSELLESLKLSKYCSLFSDNGIEDVQTLLEINEEYLSELGIPLGHKLKIMKKIKEVQKKRQLEEEEKQPIYDKNNMLPPRQEQPDYEELPYNEPARKTTQS